MISVKSIFKKYPKKVVVDDVTIDIKKGKVTSFIGPNGAGKSTVLSIITRLTECDGGEVLIEGKPLKDWDKSDLSKKISILKQSNNINLKLTVRELVSFGRFPHSQGRLTDEDEVKIDEAIEYMKLKEFEDRYIDELSGGQRQRAYIAMVIAQDTEYVFLDEPLNNLDMKHCVEMMKAVRSLCDNLGKTVILVMHDINYTSCYSDYIVALKDGKMCKYGKTEEIIKEDVLNEIYDMDFDIQNVDGRNICVYF
ncbi:MAG: ATP-binding cassette domain-containing protein [Peptostreptococcaceae bacterium]